ncbi:hypothetical protein N665_0209s0001, partial [Sinapis alba]
MVIADREACNRTDSLPLFFLVIFDHRKKKKKKQIRVSWVLRNFEDMSGKRVIAICMSGGEFQTEKGGALTYKGGDAHAIDVDEEMEFKDFISEIGEMFNCDARTVCLKYFLPDNKKTLISISNDKDLKRMIKFHENSNSADVYLIPEEPAP